MRALATILLARHLGQTLTPELLTDVLRSFPADGAPLDLSVVAPRDCGRMVFHVERMRDIVPELDALHAEHYRETESYYRGHPMKPDYAAAIVDEQEGRMVQITARDRATRALVGNARMYLSTSRHNGRVLATEDTIYLLPDYRIGRNGVRFVEYAEATVRQLGAQDCFMDDKVGNPAAGRILGYLGYEHIANRRYKNLEDPHVLKRT